MKIKLIGLIALLNLIFVANVAPFSVASSNDNVSRKNYIVESSGDVTYTTINETSKNSFGLLLTPIQHFVVAITLFVLIHKVSYTSYTALFNILVVYPLGELAPPYSYNL